MVMMWSSRFRFTWSTLAARVVDLPEPVGPVTSTSPFERKHRSRIGFGRPISSAERTVDGIWRITDPMP